ncbi:MAG: hypothetical protein AB2L20_21980 [Mangrovibacterium sp.]
MMNSLVKIDYKRYLSNHNVNYEFLTDNVYDGLPIGNGTMGGIVQVRSYGIKLLVNRADVLGCNSYTDVKAERVVHPLHHANCCGWLEIDFGDNAFPKKTFQGLEYFNGLGTVNGGGIEIKIIACNYTDIIIFHVKDTRKSKEKQFIRLRLRMMRPPVLRSGPRPLKVESKLESSGNNIFLIQEYHEPGIESIPNSEHYCSSALMLSFKGDQVSEQHIEAKGEQVLELVTDATDEYDIIISSSATLSKSQDVALLADAAMQKISKRPFNTLLSEQESWWSKFWKKSFICMRSNDGKAEYLERGWVGWLYSMACCSRNRFVPHWNVLLWRNKGDWEMSWSGPRMWGWNLQTHYEGILGSNHRELMEPYLNSYWMGIENGRWHAQNIRSSKGTYLSETQFWNGIRTYQNISEDILSELREFLFHRKSWDELSENYKDFVRKFTGYDETLWGYDFYCDDKNIEPYVYHSHCFSTGAKVAWRFFLVWEYTQDISFLREKAYPLIRDMAEFYRNYPDVKKEEDGKYHIHNVHSHEPLWGAQDTMEELCAMKAMVTLVYRLATFLETDKELQPLWKDLADHCASVPTTKHPDAIIPYNGKTEPERWVQGLNPYFKMGGIESATPSRQWVHYDLATLETGDSELQRLAMSTLEPEPWYQALNKGDATFCLSEIPTIAVMMGLADKTRDWLPKQLSGVGWRDVIRVQKNNLMVCVNQNEWNGDITMEGFGYSAYNTQLALLQSVAPAPGLDPVIRVFPAWPVEWNASFKLAARRGFTVSSTMKDGRIRFVEIISTLGETCRIRNPWGNERISVFKTEGENGWKKILSSSSGLLEFNTSAEDSFVILPGRIKPDDIKNDFNVDLNFNNKAYNEWIPQ